jgi:hypothetical protein
MGESWAGASNILPETNLSELQKAAPACTVRILALLPEPFRQKIAGKAWRSVKLIFLRSLVAWHVAPAFRIAVVAGLLEGSWARAVPFHSGSRSPSRRLADVAGPS